MFAAFTYINTESYIKFISESHFILPERLRASFYKQFLAVVAKVKAYMYNQSLSLKTHEIRKDDD